MVIPNSLPSGRHRVSVIWDIASITHSMDYRKQKHPSEEGSALGLDAVGFMILLSFQPAACG